MIAFEDLLKIIEKRLKHNHSMDERRSTSDKQVERDNTVLAESVAGISLSGICCSHYSVLPNAIIEAIASKKSDKLAIYKKLCKYCEERNIKPSTLYKQAGVSRNTWSKLGLAEETGYVPSKNTLLQFAIALKLPLNETQELLKLGGYAFSPDDDFDIIVAACIEYGYYDIDSINDILYDKTGACFISI